MFVRVILGGEEESGGGCMGRGSVVGMSFVVDF